MFPCWLPKSLNRSSQPSSRPLVDASLRIAIGRQLDALHRQPGALVEEQEVFAWRRSEAKTVGVVVTWRVLETPEKNSGENGISPSDIGGSKSHKS